LNDQHINQTRVGKLKILKKISVYFKPYLGTAVLTLIVLIIAATATLSLPIAIRHIVDQGFFVEQAQNIDRYFLILLAIVLVLALASSVRFYLVMWLGERIVADIRSAVYHHIIFMDPTFFETTHTGEVQSRITTDTTLVLSVVGAGISITLRMLFMFVGSLFMLIITSPKLTAYIFVLVPFVVFPLLFYGRKIRQLSRITQDCIAQSSAIAGETLNAIRIVQAYVLETFFSQRFTQSVEQAFNSARKRMLARSILNACAVVIVFGGIIAVLWLGTQFVLDNKMTIGELSQFLIYAIIMATSIAALSEVWGEIQRAAGAMERLLELLDSQPAIATTPSSLTLSDCSQSAIHFENIGFHYPSRPKQPALTNFSLTIKPGETIALVGPSGAGKSTVFQLLLRFYDPQQGIIKIGDTNISHIDPQQLRKQFGLVPQRTVIFAESVMANIRYGKLDATDQEIMIAAKAAAADEFIKQLPDSYDSYLGEQGTRLSGGQQQRIAIARAILKNPPILLLDEATSSLDAHSEKRVQEALENLMKDRTTLVIAHRLATVLKADRIVVMDQGRIVAAGSHSQLLAEDGLYARLAALQFANI
jgi:ATP-binding cassette subfamily B protein